MMKREIDDFLNGTFSQTISECQKFLYIARAEEYQIQSIEKLHQLDNEVKSLKKMAIEQQDEDSANTLLSVEYLVKTLIGELKMWLELKNGKPDKAWNHLVEAQINLQDSCQVDNLPNISCEGYMNKLLILEKILFPAQIFASPGYVAEDCECSICGKDYNECDHITGKAYMGEMCYTILRNVRFVEFSIVDEPSDKHARITEFSDGDVIRDRMTWREISKSS